jgi:hypothetical protein
MSEQAVLHEVRARFDSSERMQDAAGRLALAGFDRADLSLPEPDAGQTPESGAKELDSEEDARQARTLHTSGVGAAAALAAAGITVATGGAALPAVAAAVIVGGVAGGATFAVSTAANAGEQADRDARAAQGMLLVSARAPTEAKREEAAAILLEAGGMDIEIT